MTTPCLAVRTVDSALRTEVLAGLALPQKTLPPKLFYDAAGAALFERICELDEYYLTRAELSILRARAGEIAALVGPGAALVEYGSGAGMKVRLLLDAMHAPAAYVPLDISREQLARVVTQLSGDYPHVPILPVCADYTQPLTVPDLPQRARRVAFFPGSSIGNFHPTEAAVFLRRVRRVIGKDGALLLGVDRHKQESVLHAAYDDREGVTAAFNLNALARLNHDFGADFDLAAFQHRAIWDAGVGRTEMHLESRTAQTAHLAGERFFMAQGETIWTESSYKYDRRRLDQLVTEGGFRVERRWTDEREQFWLAFLVVT
jgi:dimethylhistidine N-methyltransferase